MKVMINHILHSPLPPSPGIFKTKSACRMGKTTSSKGPLGLLPGRIFKISNSQLPKHNAFILRHRKIDCHAGYGLAAFDFLVLNAQSR